MKTKRITSALILTVIVFLGCKKEPAAVQTNGVSGSAQTENAVGTKKVFARGLNNPRQLKFGPDGYLYVAEAGKGGTDSTVGICTQIPPPNGPFVGSPRGSRISKISPSGERTTVINTLPSSNGTDAAGRPVLGVADVAFMNGNLYAVLAGAGCSHGVQSVDNGVVKIHEDGSWRLIANTSAFSAANPVKNPDEDDYSVDGNPYSMIRVDNNLYVLEPNHGELLKVSKDGNITRIVDISATQGHIVPTALAYFEGNFYVGNLDTFPIIEGGAKIFKITPEGKISVWARGFTTILGLVFDRKGRFYVLENTTKNLFPTPGTGKIIRVDRSKDADKREVIVNQLDLPTGLTMGPDGKLYVSNWGLGPNGLGGGQILQVDVPK